MYDDWLGNIAKRFQASFDEISIEHNFEYGPEFEVALCEVLKTILPHRAAVCRGYVVAKDGTTAGDDIIVFDSARFPVLRALGNDLSRKERVPAEAVLAYIEAKHTLDVGGTSAQSLTKASTQVASIKALARTTLEHRYRVPGLDLGPQVQSPPSFPTILNPWYTAIWSRRATWPSTSRIVDPRLLDQPASLVPDVVATDDGCLLPVLKKANTGGHLRFEIRPFLCSGTEHAWSSTKGFGLGVAAVHLLWAIEWITLSELPWNAMMGDCLRKGAITWFETS